MWRIRKLIGLILGILVLFPEVYMLPRYLNSSEKWIGNRTIPDLAEIISCQLPSGLPWIPSRKRLKRFNSKSTTTYSSRQNDLNRSCQFHWGLKMISYQHIFMLWQKQMPPTVNKCIMESDKGSLMKSRYVCIKGLLTKHNCKMGCSWLLCVNCLLCFSLHILIP